MNLLIDTHALLWWLDDHPSLSEKARVVIADGNNLVFVSAAVIWEIRIKQALGKLRVPANFGQILNKQPMEMLAITVEHVQAVKDLPFNHRDPFDRMLIAQAAVEGFTIVSHDKNFKQFKIPIIRN